MRIKNRNTGEEHRIFNNPTILKIYRQFSRDEAVQILVEELKKMKDEMSVLAIRTGMMRSDLDELQDMNKKLETENIQFRSQSDTGIPMETLDQELYVQQLKKGIEQQREGRQEERKRRIEEMAKNGTLRALLEKHGITEGIPAK